MIELIFINSLLCLGFYQACTYYQAERQVDTGGYFSTQVYHEKGLLWFIPYYLRNAPWWFNKPIHACLTCMAGLHSYPYWIINDFTLTNLYFYPAYILALAGANFILDQITAKLNE